jgi:hypothetical protein
LGVVFVLRFRKAHNHRHQVVRIETAINIEQPVETLYQQSGARQKN